MKQDCRGGLCLLRSQDKSRYGMQALPIDWSGEYTFFILTAGFASTWQHSTQLTEDGTCAMFLISYS